MNSRNPAVIIYNEDGYVAVHEEDTDITGQGSSRVLIAGLDDGVVKTPSVKDIGSEPLSSDRVISAEMGSILSDLNSTSVALGASASFTGTAENVAQFTEIDLSCTKLPEAAPGTLFFEFSPDGVNWDVSIPIDMENIEGIVPIPLRTIVPYYRIRYENGGTPLSTLRINSFLRRGSGKHLTRFLNQEITSLEPVENVRAISAGESFESSTFINKQIDIHTIDSGNRLPGPLTNGAITTFTVNFGTDIFTAASHGLTVGDAVHLTTTDTLPAPLEDTDSNNNEVPYWVESVPDIDSFTLSTAPTGSAIDITDSGIGTHSFQQRGQFVGSFSNTSQIGSFLDFFISDVNPIIVRQEWSADGININADILGFIDEEIKLSNTPAGVFYLSALPVTSMLAKFRRIRIVNGPSDQTSLTSDFVPLVNRETYGGTFINIESELSTIASALLTRSVISGLSPSGEFINVRADGVALSESTPLPANSTFTSDWVSTKGWVYLENFIVADQISAIDGFVVEFTDDVEVTTPLIKGTIGFSFTQNDVDNGSRVFRIPALLNGFRIKFTNGIIGQNVFELFTTLRKEPFNPETVINSNLNAQTRAVITKSVISAIDDNGNFNIISQSPGGGIRTSITEIEAELPIKPLTTWRSRQVTINDASPIQLAPTPLPDRKTIVFKNNGDNDRDVFIGSAATVTINNGFPVAQFESVELEIDENAELWAISASAGGGGATQNLNTNSTTVNNGVTNPNNVFTSNDVRAIIDSAGENATWDIDDFTFGLGNDQITSVKLKIEARKENISTATVTLLQTVTESGNGGTSITSPLISFGTDQCYVAFISNGDSNIRNVNSVIGGGLTWVEIGDIIGSEAVTGISCWVATGSPLSDFSVVANFSGIVERKALSVHRYSGVDQSSPVQASDTHEAPGTGNNSITSDSITGTATNGRFIVGINSRDREPTITTPANLIADLSVGNKVSHEVNDGVAAASNQASGTHTSGAPDWVLIAITLKPSGSIDPIFRLTYIIPGDGEGSTDLIQEVTQTTDTIFTIDVTGDRSWTDSDLDSMQIKLEIQTIGVADLEVDHVFVEVGENASLNTQRCALIEIA